MIALLLSASLAEAQATQAATKATVTTAAAAKRRVIFYNPAPSYSNNETTVNTSNVFDAPKLCSPGYRLDRHNKCRRQMN
uniref:Putative secreted protein n=1 Tax=Anopheles triannulatus TaxID=58253 RepID=A0A2M4B7T5_9DIPT